MEKLYISLSKTTHTTNGMDAGNTEAQMACFGALMFLPQVSPIIIKS